MAKRELKYENPRCGYCNAQTRATTIKQTRICERGHKIIVKRGTRH